MGPMHVLLAASPHADTFGYAMPPPGLLRLGGELLRRGIDVRIEDLPHRLATGVLPGDDQLADRAAELLTRGSDFDVLGLSVMGATTPIALAIAERVKASRPGVRIVLGGPGTTGIDGELLARFPFLDAIVRGEGEESFPALLECWSQGTSLRGTAGLTWRAPDGKIEREANRPPLSDLGGLADYAWELFPPFANYAALTESGEGLVPIDSGRGCAFDCSFCTIGRFWNRRSRTLPVSRLLDEVAAIRGIPGGRQAYLCHDIFGAQRDHALRFARGMHSRAIDVPWECRARLDHLDEELIAAMAAGGCYRVLLGIESGDADLRNAHDKSMGKDTHPAAVVERLARHGITPILSFLLGLPGEGDPELRATLDLALELSLVTGVNLSLHLPNPQPGCRLGEEHAATSTPLAGVEPDMAFGAGTTRAERELIAAHPDLFSTWSLLTGLPGGEAHVLRLAKLAASFPPLLEQRARTFALLARSLGLDALDLFDRWQASELPFDRFAESSTEALVRDALTWERAIEAGPHTRPTLVEVDTDPVTASIWLRTNTGWPPPVGETTHLALLRGDRGVRTLRLSTQAATLIALAHNEPGRLRELSHEHAALLAPLQEDGLIPTP